MNRHRLNLLLTLCFAFTFPLSTTQADDAATSAFLARHWQRPLPHQGEPPASFSELEVALDPRACGTCHAQQFQDWQGSLHAHAMGPGMLGQLMDMAPGDRTEHQACLRCHAPLAEQADEVVAWLSAGDDNIPNPSEGAIPQGPLYSQGLICAGCHLRNYRVYGPHSNKYRLPHHPWVKTPVSPMPAGKLRMRLSAPASVQPVTSLQRTVMHSTVNCLKTPSQSGKPALRQNRE